MRIVGGIFEASYHILLTVFSTATLLYVSHEKGKKQLKNGPKSWADRSPN